MRAGTVASHAAPGALAPRSVAAMVTIVLLAALAVPARSAQRGSGGTTRGALPPFEVELVGTGERIGPADLVGGWTLIDFWATWCGPCVAAIPHLEEARAAYGGYGFEILGISLDGDAARVERFRRRRSEMPWLHAVPPGGMRSEVARSFGIRGVPTYLLVGPDGTVVERGSSLHGRNLAGTLRRLILETDATSAR